MTFLHSTAVSKHMSLYTTHLIIQHHLDILMERFVNAGLIHHFEVQSRIALGVRTSAGSSQTQETASTSITLHELFFVVVLVALGQLASVVVFGVEWLVWRLTIERQRNGDK